MNSFIEIFWEFSKITFWDFFCRKIFFRKLTQNSASKQLMCVYLRKLLLKLSLQSLRWLYNTYIFCNLVPRAIFKRQSTRLPLIAKRCAGDEVDIFWCCRLNLLLLLLLLFFIALCFLTFSYFSESLLR